MNSAKPSTLEDLTTEERALLQAFRRCTSEAKSDLYRLAVTAAIRCISQPTAKIIPLRRA